MDEAEYCNRLALISDGRLVSLGTPTELKRRSMKGDVLLVECDPLAAALDLLTLAPGVLDAAVFGDAIHLLVPDAAQALSTLPGYLAEQGVNCARIESIHPSLEDVFVALSARDRSVQAAREEPSP